MKIETKTEVIVPAVAEVTEDRIVLVLTEQEAMALAALYGANHGCTVPAPVRAIFRQLHSSVCNSVAYEVFCKSADYKLLREVWRK